MVISTNTSAIYKIQSILPKNISMAINRLDTQTAESISEIRLRSEGITTVTLAGQNCILSSYGLTKNVSDSLYISKEELEDFLFKLCKGSVYSHESTLNDFFVTSNGIRVGFGGSAGSGTNVGITEITSACIRLPRHIENCSDEIRKHIAENGFPDGKGILIISPPGLGKTTHLRDLAKSLSSFECSLEPKKAYRVCVIDERFEIFMPKIFDRCCIDFISGVDKIKGLETATRVLSPEIIICDEIASPLEAEKIIRHKNSGTVFIASLHGDAPKSVLEKDYIKAMFDEKVFGGIYSLQRQSNGVISGSFYFTENKDND